MATIKQIDGRTVHQIQSGQVIVDLCSVVKELVENSIDAGSTIIDVRFKNQGLDLIEVQDNGSGIAPANYASLALKHHTSKLSSYADIASLQTFGFRGEALASLCALSTLVVTTCLATDVPKATRLNFEPSGKLSGTSVVAAQRGTTVAVETLFHNLPVRRRELERNIKREWQKVIALLNQYACIQTSLKFSVSQQPTKGKRIVMFSTKGNPTTRENIINIFGAKTMGALVPLDLVLQMRPSTVGPATAAPPISNSASQEVRVVGHVSRPVHGEGRQTPDRQMFFVNGRPCGLPQFAKTFNEVYRSYNSNQSPFIFADIQLDTSMYDVNVSPDKRSILLHDQNHMLDSLRSSLVELFDTHDYTVPVAWPTNKRQDSLDTSKIHTATPTPVTRPERRAGRTPSDLGTDSDGKAEGSVSSEDEDADASPEADESWRRARITSSRVLVKEGRNQNLISQWVERGPRPSPSASARSASITNERSTPQIMASQIARGANISSSSSSEAPGSSAESSDDGSDDGSDGGSDDGSGGELVNNAPPESINEQPDALDTEEPITSEIPRNQSVEPNTPSETGVPGTPSASLGRLGSGGLISQLSTRPFLKRPAAEPPNVMIGGHITSSTAGSSPKQTRSTKHSHTAHTHTPSFGGVLSQLYSADGRADRPEPSSEREDMDDDEVSRASSPTHAASATMDTAMGASLEDSAVSPEDQPSGGSPSQAVDDVAHTEPTALADAPVDHGVTLNLSGVPEPRSHSFHGGARRKDTTFQCVQTLHLDEEYIHSAMRQRSTGCLAVSPATSPAAVVEDISAPDAEAKLPLVITRSDFARMKVAGQFNMGFIIAVRPSNMNGADQEGPEHDELFIIDQHASDEKYNFERLQSNTVVQSQRLVHPKRLELTALEEEIVMHNTTAIENNGFKVDIDTTGEQPVGSRCQLLALPLSREITFSLTDLEELISLLGDESSESTHIPRPSKVRKMFAMRACRSSIMIGKAMTLSQMHTLVRNMGELDKPWNCPHGRPTMRHLCRLQTWDEKGWRADAANTTLSAWQSYATEN